MWATEPVVTTNCHKQIELNYPVQQHIDLESLLIQLAAFNTARRHMSLQIEL
jgi:hypothetical protein